MYVVVKQLVQTCERLRYSVHGVRFVYHSTTDCGVRYSISDNVYFSHIPSIVNTVFLVVNEYQFVTSKFNFCVFMYDEWIAASKIPDFC